MQALDRRHVHPPLYTTRFISHLPRSRQSILFVAIVFVVLCTMQAILRISLPLSLQLRTPDLTDILGFARSVSPAPPRTARLEAWGWVSRTVDRHQPGMVLNHFIERPTPVSVKRVLKVCGARAKEHEIS